MRRSVSITSAGRSARRGSPPARRPRMTRGSWARILAIATRCCSPPDSVSARCQARVDQPDVVRGSAARASRSVGGEPARPAPPSRRQPRRCGRRPDQHVVQDAQPLHQVELLVDHADPRAVGAEPRSRQRPQVDVAEADRARRWDDGAGQAAQQRGLPGPGAADDRDELAGVDAGRDPIERDLSAEAPADPLQHHYRGGRRAHLADHPSGPVLQGRDPPVKLAQRALAARSPRDRPRSATRSRSFDRW